MPLPLPVGLHEAPDFGDFTDEDLDSTPPPDQSHWHGHIPGARGHYWTPARFLADHSFGPTGEGAASAHVVAMPFCFAEVDPEGTLEQKQDPLWCAARVDEQLRHIATLVDRGRIPHPTMLVLSGDPRHAAPGKSVHAYWQVDPPVDPRNAHDLTRWRATQTALAVALGPDADRRLTDPSRRMRLPGGLHEGRHQTIAYFNGPTHTLDAMSQWAEARLRADPATQQAVAAATSPARTVDVRFVDYPELVDLHPEPGAKQKTRCINPEHPDQHPSAFVSAKPVRRLGANGRFETVHQRYLHCSKCDITWWDEASSSTPTGPSEPAAPHAAVARALARTADAPPPLVQDEDPPPPAAPQSDGTGIENARSLVALMQGNYRWALERKEWATWSPTRGHWHLSPTVANDVFHLAHRVADVHRVEVSNAMSLTPLKQRMANYRHAASASGLREMVDVARMGGFPEVGGSAEVFDQLPGVINTGGQTLHLPLDPAVPIVPRAPRREDYLTRATPPSMPPYDPKARCPRFERFILEVMDGNAEHAAFLQRALGYAMSGYCREQKMFFMQGDGGNGKGVLQRAISDALGPEYTTSAKAETFIERHGDPAVPVDLASWAGRRFVFPEELPQNRRMDSAILKTCTGEDPIRARLMRENFFEYKGQFTLFFSANPGYEIDVSDPAMRRRFVLIPFNRSFRDNPDLSLRDTLRAEGPGIIRWLVDGFDAYRRQGLAIPQAMQDAAAEVRLAGDVVAQFLDDRITDTPPTSASKPITNERLYTLFKSWCERNGERFVPSQRRLTQRMVSKGHKQERAGGGARNWPALYEVPQTLGVHVAQATARPAPDAPAH